MKIASGWRLLCLWLALPGLANGADPVAPDHPAPAAQDQARDLALSALQAARNAVNHSEAPAPQRQDAREKLKQAEQLFEARQFDQAASAADSAWQLLSGTNQTTRFAVQVASNGATEVQAHTGNPVRLEARGATQAVYPGQAASVQPGQRPSSPRAALAAPASLTPSDGVKLPQGARRLLVLRWSEVPGAVRYRVELTGPKNLSLEVEKSQSQLPPLGAGRYQWTVQALGAEGQSSQRSNPVSFELTLEPLELEVGKSTWK